MPVYKFLVPKGIGGVQSAAERCGFTSSQVESGWCFTGDVAPSNAKAFADYLTTFKLSYELERPNFTELADVDLIDVVFKRDDPMRDGWKVKDNVYRLMQGKHFVKDLPLCRFDDIMATLHQDLGTQYWQVLAVMLRFMIEHEVDFEDLSPRSTFTTPIEELRLSTRLTGRLKAAGIRWIALLDYITLAELYDIKQFGERSVAELRARLPRDHPLNRR